MSSFLLDLGISPKVITMLVSLSHQGKHCNEVGLAKSPDRDILDYAIRHKSILVTSDLGFSDLAVFEQRLVPGVIILRLRNPNATKMAAHLQQLLTGPDADRIYQAITIVEPHQVRITKLPLKRSR